jgi:hypothetical protein
VLGESLTPPLTKAFGFLNQKDPEQEWRETHELFHGKLELIEELALIKQLEQPAAEKAKEAKEAEGFTCRYKGCNGKYTDATSSEAKSKRTYGFCSSVCRETAKKAPRAPPTQCEHGRRKHKCKDCGTSYCQHGRRKSQCKDCGTGYCQHGRLNGRCRDCNRQ